MSGRNWERARLRSAISRHGSETVVADSSYPADMRLPTKVRRRMSKQEMRAEAEALMKAGHVAVSHTVTRDVALPGVTKHLKAPKKAPRGRRRARPDSGGAVRYADIAVPAGLVIYADGCCDPNPGVGGWGFAVYRDGVEVHSASGGDLEATNQRMELTAALQAVLWLTANVDSEAANVRLISDSKYTVTGCNEWRHNWKRRGWRRKSAEAAEKNQVVANLDLWKELDAALTATPITLEWVKGHCGVIGNERADELSLIGRDAALEDQPPTVLDLIKQQLRGIE